MARSGKVSSRQLYLTLHFHWFPVMVQMQNKEGPIQ